MNYERAHEYFIQYTKGTGNIDNYYGPSNRAARRAFLEAWTGRQVTLSGAGWHVFRDAVLALYNAPLDECMAIQDHFIADKARAA